MYRNVLSKESYIISEKLFTALNNEELSEGKSEMSKASGMYLIAVRVLNKSNNTLVYNYIYYNPIFVESFLIFLLYRDENSIRLQEWGGCIIYVDNKILKYLNSRYHVSNDNKYFVRNVHNIIKSLSNLNDYYVDSVVHKLILIINNFNYIFKDYNELTQILDIILRKEYSKYIEHILGSLLKSYPIYTEYKSESKDISLLNSTLFLVKDLSMFRENIENKGIVINEGVQKWRGQVNSMGGILSTIDMDYRNSLYNHHNYHSKIGVVSPAYILPKSKFSFRNVHMNLGNIRWYSKNRTITKNIVSKKLVDKINSHSFRTDTIIYLYLSRFLKQSNINEQTERELESFLLEYSYNKLSNKDKRMEYDIFKNNKIQKILFDFIKVLKDYLKNFRNKTIKISNKSSQNSMNRYHLNLILKKLDDEFIIQLSLGIISKIFSNYNKLNDDCINVNIFSEVGNTIISRYFYSLYKNHIYEGLLLFGSEYLKSLKSSNIKDKEVRLGMVNNLIANITKKEIHELLYIAKKLLLMDNTNINLNNTELITQYTLSDWKLDNKDLVENYENNSTLKNCVGALIVEWWIDSGLVQQITVNITRKDRRNFIVPSNNIIQILDENKDYTIKHLPLRIPMIIKPKNYHRENIKGQMKERLGGYLLNDEKVTDNMIIPNWQLKQPSLIKEKNIVYDLVNNVNSVGFKINKEMLDFIYTYNDQFNLLLNTIDIKEIKSRVSKKEFTELESHVSRLDLQENILGIAKVYSNIPELFLPVRIDYRGRMNCVSQYLNYQSTELAKSLLLFSKGEKLLKNDKIAINYFKSYGANCYGNKLNKKSWEERAQWVDLNENNILDFTNGELISKADNKLLFAAFCLEYIKWKKSLDNIESSYFTTYLPIQLDASCNGYQHLALLIYDYDMGKELNLTKSSSEDLPKDYYGFTIIKLNELFRAKIKDARVSDEDKACYKRLCSTFIKRGTIKTAVMTIPYNVSTPQMIKYLKEHFIKLESNKTESNKTEKWSCYKLEYQYKDDTDILLCSRDITIIAAGLREVLELNFPKLKLLVTYLKEIATICNKLNLVIPWGTSSGLLVNQSYTKTEEVKLRPFSYSKSSFTLKVPTKGLNTHKQVRAFMPNLIHSLDAASLALLAQHCFNANINNFYAIHDCFAVTANNIDKLIKFLKLVYIKIYSEDEYLRKFNKEIIQHIKYHYGEDCFNDETLEINFNDTNLKYPDINYVLGNRLPDSHWIKGSSYLVN